jgi:hypothetical protein
LETIRKTCRVDRHEINYIRVTLESYDGMAVVRTMDPEEAVIEILIAPGCETLIEDLLEALRRDENIKIEDLTNNASPYVNHED